MIRRVRLMAALGAFLFGCAVLSVAGCAGVRSEAPREEQERLGAINEQQARSPGVPFGAGLDRAVGAAEAAARLGALGVTPRSGREPVDTFPTPGRPVYQMLASFAEYDRENLIEGVQAGLHRATMSPFRLL